MWNLMTLCSAHHKSHHEGLLSIRGKAPHELEFIWKACSSNPTTTGIDTASQLTSSSPGIGLAFQCATSSMVIDATSQVATARSVIDPTGYASSSPRQPMKLNPPIVLEAARPDADDRVSTATIDDEARTALVTAGYKSHEARVAVKKARPHVGASASLEQLIREALRQCALLSRISHRPARGNSC
jgi:hypothetical protein